MGYIVGDRQQTDPKSASEYFPLCLLYDDASLFFEVGPEHEHILFSPVLHYEGVGINLFD